MQNIIQFYSLEIIQYYIHIAIAKHDATMRRDYITLYYNELVLYKSTEYVVYKIDVKLGLGQDYNFYI